MARRRSRSEGSVLSVVVVEEAVAVAVETAVVVVDSVVAAAVVVVVAVVTTNMVTTIMTLTAPVSLFLDPRSLVEAVAALGVAQEVVVSRRVPWRARAVQTSSFQDDLRKVRCTLIIY